MNVFAAVRMRGAHLDENEAVTKNAERQDNDVDDDDDGGEPRPAQRLELGSLLQPLEIRESFTVGREEKGSVAAVRCRCRRSSRSANRRHVVVSVREAGAE